MRPGRERQAPRAQTPSVRPQGPGPAPVASLAARLLRQLSMLRISPSMGHALEVHLALRHLLFLLEYCMVTGYDWWDILLHVQPGMVQSLVEKLHEEYTRQNAALQQVSRAGGGGRARTRCVHTCTHRAFSEGTPVCSALCHPSSGGSLRPHDR